MTSTYKTVSHCKSLGGQHHCKNVQHQRVMVYHYQEMLTVESFHIAYSSVFVGLYNKSINGCMGPSGELSMLQNDCCAQKYLNISVGSALGNIEISWDQLSCVNCYIFSNISTFRKMTEVYTCIQHLNPKTAHQCLVIKYRLLTPIENLLPLF